MPQLQNLVLTDRAATPVAHTYTPLEISNGVGVVVESSGVPVGNNRFSISLRKTSTGKYKVQMNLTLPIVQNETINGVTTPKVVRTGYAECTFTMDSTSTLQERKDLVGLLYSALDPAKVLVNDTVTNLQGIY